MAKLEFEYNQSDFDAFRKLADQFPELRARMMGYVGKKGTKVLYYNFLRGQAIDLKKYPTDASNRETVKYSIGRNAKYVRITSYPLNLFEKGRVWKKSGKKETGKRVMSRGFKQMMNSNLQRILMDFDKSILQKELDKL